MASVRVRRIGDEQPNRLSPRGLQVSRNRAPRDIATVTFAPSGTPRDDPTARGGRGMSVAQAEEATVRGDHDDALRTLESILADMGHTEFASAARVAAAIHAHRGSLNRSAELLQLMAPEALGDGAAAGAVALVGTGDVAAADRMIAASRGDAPTTSAAAWRLATTGLVHSVSGDGVAGMSPLVQSVAALAPVGRDGIMLDTPAALA